MGKRKLILYLGICMVVSVIVVLELRTLVGNASDPLALPQKCLLQPDGYNGSWSCLSPYFERITNEVSTSVAMAEARKFKEQKMVSDCHLFAHVIGETSLEKHNFDTGKAFSSCTFGCSDGCFHGVMERYIRNETDPYSITSKVKNMCDSVGTDWVQKRRCVHGVGHGLAGHEYLPIPEAINVCEAFGSDWAFFCIGGLAMEGMDQYLAAGLDENNLTKIFQKICTPIEAAGYPSCMTTITLGLLYHTGYDVRRTEKLCEQFPKQEDRDSCKELIPGRIESENPSIIKGF